MCWQGKCVMRRAAEDMVAHKIMYGVGDKLYPYYYNDNFTFEYTIGERYKTSVSVIGGNEYDRIEEGFHSYGKGVHFKLEQTYTWGDVKSCILVIAANVPNILTAHMQETCPWEIDDVTTIYPNVVIVKCIVPKGASYWVNEEGEMVSTEIIITDEILLELENTAVSLQRKLS